MRVQAGRPIAHVAAEAGSARATLSKWVARYRQGGAQALEDRSSVPAHRPTRTSTETVDLIEHWRRTHKWSARRISHELAARGTVVSVRTVTRWLDRAGLNRRRDIDPTGRPNRVVKPIVARFPGHMIHLDVKKVGRIPPARRLAGPRARNPQGHSLQTRQGSQDRLHLPAHRHRRLLPPGLHRGPGLMRGPRPRSASSAGPGPLYAAHGMTRLVRVVTDNGANYRARAFTTTIASLASRHQRIRPYTPRHNGKVKCCNRILAEDRLYARTYSSQQRRRNAVAVRNHWSARCFSDRGSFSSRESIGWRACRQRDTRRSSRSRLCVRSLSRTAR